MTLPMIYIPCMKSIVDAIDKTSPRYHSARMFLSCLAIKKDEVSVDKNVVGCVPNKLHDFIIEIVVEHLEKLENTKKSYDEAERQLTFLNTLVSPLDRRAEDMKGMNPNECIFELARQLSDEHDVRIVSNNGGIKKCLKEMRVKYKDEYSEAKFEIIHTKEAVSNMIQEHNIMPITSAEDASVLAKALQEP